MFIGKRKYLAFDYVNTAIMLFICIITLYPIWYCLIYSFNDGKDSIMNGVFYWWPRVFSLQNYQVVFMDNTILQAFFITVLRTLTATFAHVFFTAMVSYAYSKQYLAGRKIYITMGMITLFFSGGLIPTYLLVRSLGLVDNFLVYIILPMFGFYDVLIFISFFKNIPPSIEESAKIDGANDFYIFLMLIIPLSLPVIAAISLFNGVYNWNDYFMGVIYINRRAELLPIQTYLYRVIATAAAQSKVTSATAGMMNITITPQSIRMATMVVTTAPIIIIYPFLQKYFTKGIMIGSVKE